MSGTASPQTGYYAYPTPISSLGQETIDLYMLGFDQALYYKQYANSTWQPSSSTFSDLHGGINANVAAVSRSLGNTDLFARADDNSILRKWRSYNQTTWYPSLQSWQSMGFWSGSSPELVSWSSDRVDAFIVGGDSLMYTVTRQESTGNWSSWSWLGANEKPHTWFNYTPTVVSWASGRYDLFGVSSANNALYHRFLVADNSWQPQTSYETLGGYCTSRPIAVSPVTGRLDVFVRGGDAGLWHIAYYSDNANTATWSNFSSLGNLSIAGEPHAVSWSADRIDVFAWGAQDHAVWHTSSPGLHTTWSPWESLGGDSSGPPKAVSKAPGQLDVFAAGRNGNLMHRDWDESRGTWNPGSGWEDLGSP
jgi:hypothetical protein